MVGNISIKQKYQITEISSGTDIEPNTIYKLETAQATIFNFPIDVDTEKHNQILIYLTTSATIEIVWDSNVVFVNDEIPTIGIGNYRIIAEFNPILAKWIVGVIQDGAVN